MWFYGSLNDNLVKYKHIASGSLKIEWSINMEILEYVTSRRYEWWNIFVKNHMTKCRQGRIASRSFTFSPSFAMYLWIHHIPKKVISTCLLQLNNHAYSPGVCLFHICILLELYGPLKWLRDSMLWGFTNKSTITKTKSVVVLLVVIVKITLYWLWLPFCNRFDLRYSKNLQGNLPVSSSA